MHLHQKLINYITRYAPSEKKLSEYISRKKHTEDIFSVIQEIGYNESFMLDIWIRTFLSLSKGEREIREKLRKKGFSKELIDKKILSVRSEISDWESHKSIIERKIDDMLVRGKSKKMILAILASKFPYFHENISEVLDGKSEERGLGKEIERYLLKYDISNFEEKSKFFASLMRKGFDSSDIKKYLALKKNIE